MGEFSKEIRGQFAIGDKPNSSEMDRQASVADRFARQSLTTVAASDSCPPTFGAAISLAQP